MRVVFPAWGETRVAFSQTGTPNAAPLVSGSSHRSLCIPTRTRWGTPCVGAELSAGASSSAAFPTPSESSSLAPSAAAAGLRTASHLRGATTQLKPFYHRAGKANSADRHPGVKMLPEPPMYLEPPPCWSRFVSSFFRRDLSIK